jgi:hypothetical protein
MGHDKPLPVEARDLMTGRRIQATLLEAAAPGGVADRVPGGRGRAVIEHVSPQACRPVPQRTVTSPGLASRAAAMQVLARSVRALARNPEAAAAAFLGGFAGLFAEALKRRR